MKSLKKRRRNDKIDYNYKKLPHYKYRLDKLKNKEKSLHNGLNSG